MTDRFDALRKALEAGAVVSYGETDQHGGIREVKDAAYIAECDPATIRALLADADRYNAFFGAGLPITFMGEEYRSKKDLDAAIDAFLTHKP